MLKELWECLFGSRKHYSNGIRDKRVQVRVTEEEKEMIEKLAELQHLDTSSFVRWLIFKKYLDDFIRNN